MKQKPAAFILMTAFAVLSAALSAACVPESVFLEILGANDYPPLFTGVRSSAPDMVEFRFSEIVSVVALRFSPELPFTVVDDETELVAVSFREPLIAGGRYTADLTVCDATGNGLTVLTPFSGRNEHTPIVRLTEIRTEYSKPKLEFAEFVILSDGSLGGLRVATATKGFDTPIFEFPPCQVKSGERVVLHFRTLDSDSRDETGAINFSGGSEASEGARDFWVPGAAKLIRKTDMVAILDQDNRILDAVVFAENGEGLWPSEALSLAATALRLSAAWRGKSEDSLEPADAAPSTTLSPTRTLCRQEGRADTDSAADWYTCATSGATPGRPNTTERHQTAKDTKNKP